MLQANGIWPKRQRHCAQTLGAQCLLRGPAQNMAQEIFRGLYPLIRNAVPCVSHGDVLHGNTNLR